MLGTELGLDNGLSMGIVSVLALSSAAIQPWAGKLKDEALISSHAGLVGGLLLIAAGLSVAAAWPSTSALFACAVLAGLGIGIATPQGFAHLAASTAPERMGRTMGSAELGREMGDAGGPLLVGSIAAAASLATGLWVLSVLVVVIAALAFVFLRRRRT